MKRATTEKTQNAREIREIAGKNICLHRARATTSYLNGNYITVLDFPPKSPDLNIKENTWDELNCRVREIESVPTTLNKFRAKIVEIQIEQPTSELRKAECDVIETSLRCGSQQCRRTDSYLNKDANFYRI